MKKFIQDHFTFWQPIALAIVLLSISIAAEWFFGFILSFGALVWMAIMFCDKGYFWDNDKR